MLKPVIACLLAQSLSFIGGSQTPMQEFRRNDSLLKNASYESASVKTVGRNLDLLLNAVYRSGRADAPLLKTWNKLAAGNDDGSMTEFSWIDADLLHLPGGLIVASATYGPISRLAAWNSQGHSIPVPDDFKYMVRWHPKLVLSGNTLLLVSDSIQDAGMRVATRVDAIALTTSGLVKGKGFEFGHTLDWGGAKARGTTLMIDRLEEPKSFFVTSAEAIFRQHDVYSVRGGNLEISGRTQLDQPLRALDAYIYLAQHAKSPNAIQRFARKVLPAQNMLNGHTERVNGDRAEITLDADGPKATFLLRRIDGRWVVESAK